MWAQWKGALVDAATQQQKVLCNVKTPWDAVRAHFMTKQPPAPGRTSSRGARTGFLDRRHFLKTAAGVGALAAACGPATPPIAQRAAARAVRLVPHADVANLDPIWITAPQSSMSASTLSHPFECASIPS
jgi:hypothetical protein